jgi:hypothetical protein
MNFYLSIYSNMYKLRDWVDCKLLTKRISIHERAVEYLEKNEHLIDNSIFNNENAIHIIEKRIKKGNWRVNCNKNAVNFLRNNRQYIRYDILAEYEHGITFMDELINNNELRKINWYGLSKNPAAMHILHDPKYYTYINWRGILYNKNAVELVKNNLHRVGQYWEDICRQPHLIEIIEQNIEKIHWVGLSENYNAIHILEKNLDKINIDKLKCNKNGFRLLLRLNHVFDNCEGYDKNIVFEYFDDCEKKNKPFNLIKMLSQYGYTEKHMNFLKHNNECMFLLLNPNIFEYDYKRMKETRESLLWYNDIKKMKNNYAYVVKCTSCRIGWIKHD